jgi:glycerate kinase
VDAPLGLLGDGRTAAVEMAAASGLPLVPPDRRDPLAASTFGTGQLIRAALEAGRRDLVIGIGGSATTDGGAGMAQALGARLLDASGHELPIIGGGRLVEVAWVDVAGLDPRLREARVRVACDVDNPLFGPRGAAHVYAPQKGATPAQVAALDEGLRHWAEVLSRDLGADVAQVPGAGAAGGLGAGLLAFCDATLERGVGMVMEVVGLAAALQGADLVLTGEGRLDAQTAFGKTIHGVARLAAEAGVPVIAIAGSVEPNPHLLHDLGLLAALSITTGPLTLAEAMEPQRARAMLTWAARQAVAMVSCASR